MYSQEDQLTADEWMNESFMSRPKDSRPILAYETAHSYNYYKRDFSKSELVVFLVQLAIGLGAIGNHS